MAEAGIEERVLDYVLQALDDLYDQRDRVEWWLEQLLFVSSVALRGTVWERQMASASAALETVRLSDDTYFDKHRAALEATGELRAMVVDYWHDYLARHPS